MSHSQKTSLNLTPLPLNPYVCLEVTMGIVDDKPHARSVMTVDELPNTELNSLKGSQCVKGNCSSFSYSSNSKSPATIFIQKLILKMVNDAVDM